MPLYEYRCTACNRLTEKRQKFSDPEITECPHCGGKLERTITAPAIQFKGGGWYADGYGNKKPAASGEGGGATSSAESQGAEGTKSAEGTKPAAGGETPASSSTTAAPAAPSTAAPAGSSASSDK